MNTRVNNLRSLLEKKHLDALLISSTENIGYLTYLFHFSRSEREALLLITQDHIFLFTDSRFAGMLKITPEITFIETSARCGVYAEIESLLVNKNIASVGYEATNIRVTEYQALKKAARTRAKLVTADKICAQMRIIKDANEITKILYACELTDNAFRYIQPFITVGVTEIELADRIDNFFKRNNASNAFPPIVAFGSHAAVPHHTPTAKELTSTDYYILFDLGARFHHYCGDLSRTIFIGEISDEIRNQHTAVLTSQERALTTLKKKVRRAKDSDLVARKSLHDQGYPTIPHAVGHGIGLSVHEAPSVSPRSKSALTKGMVITIEPGLYIPNQGGIRIEDTVLITEKGYELLTKSPKKLLIL